MLSAAFAVNVGNIAIWVLDYRQWVCTRLDADRIRWAGIRVGRAHDIFTHDASFTESLTKPSDTWPDAISARMTNTSCSPVCSDKTLSIAFCTTGSFFTSLPHYHVVAHRDLAACSTFGAVNPTSAHVSGASASHLKAYSTAASLVSV